MSAVLFLSPSLSNSPNFAYHCNPIASSHHKPILLPIFPHSLSNPVKPIYSSNPPKSNFSTFSTTSFCTTANNNKNDNSRVKSEPFLRANFATKMPTAPWMKGPLLVEPNQVLDLSKSRKDNNFNNDRSEKPNQSLTDRVSGGRCKKAMKKIFQGIGKLQENHNLEGTETQKSPEQVKLDFLMGEFQNDGNSDFAGRMPWERDEKVVSRRMKKQKVVTAAELSLDAVLLEGLRTEAPKMRKWVKVKKAGVTEAVVDQIRFIWKNNELVMLKFDIPLSRNMDRAREIVELCLFQNSWFMNS